MQKDLFSYFMLRITQVLYEFTGGCYEELSEELAAELKSGGLSRVEFEHLTALLRGG